MKILFSHITEQLPYPAKYKAALQNAHSALVSGAMICYTGSRRCKTDIIKILNLISYYIVTGTDIASIWNPNSIFTMNADTDPEDLQEVLKDLYVSMSDVTWDISPVIPDAKPKAKKSEPITDKKKVLIPIDVPEEFRTPKSHLYLGTLPFPQFDYNKPWIQAVVNGEPYAIYTSLPEVPTNQSEITVTTNPDMLTENDVMKLYPNCVIHTRAPIFYERMSQFEYDDTLGVIFPILDFTVEEIKDNIIKYPHLHNLMKQVNDDFQPFYSTLEIDGELYDVKTREVWDSIPDLARLPFNIDFLKEYVIRRYILEKDLRQQEHKYHMFGTLEPFITMFMPPEEYEARGYDSKFVAKSCVASRVSYFRSRNPILRKIYGADAT